MPSWAATWLSSCCLQPGPLHDATVTAHLLNPNLFYGRRVRVEIECESPLNDG
jgi:inosine-uridine nucleoside N-ribohydrolase